MSTLSTSAGPTAIQKMQRLLGGFSGVNMVPPLNRCFGIFFARSGTGKSRTLQSIPGAFIFNIDASSTVFPNSPATIWPGVDPQNGAPIEACNPGDAGAFQHPQLGWVRRIELTWELILKKKDELLEYIKAHPNDVSCVVFDTVTSCLPLLIDHEVEQARKRVGTNKTIESWDDLNSLNKWSAIYDDFVALVKEIKRAGVGVIVAVHLTDKFVNGEGGAKTLMKDMPQISDAFKGRLIPDTEFVCLLDMVSETVNEPIQAKGLDFKLLFDATGKPVMKDNFVSVNRVYASFDATAGPRLAKGRGITGRVLLDKANPWGSLQAAYEKSIAEFAPTPQK